MADSRDFSNAAPEAGNRPEAASANSSSLRDAVADRTAGLLSWISDSILADIETEFGEGKKLFRLYNAVKDAKYRDLSEDEYRILLDYGCVYDEVSLKTRLDREIAWFEEKKAILDGASGFWKFYQRSKLEYESIPEWFGKEYRTKFPDGNFWYGGHSHAQTTETVNARLAALRDPSFGRFPRPLMTNRGKEWRSRLSDLVNVARNRRSVDSESYADLRDSGGIWLAPSAIAAFAVIGMTSSAEAGGFWFSPRKTEEVLRSDGG